MKTLAYYKGLLARWLDILDRVDNNYEILVCVVHILEAKMQINEIEDRVLKG